MRGCRVIDMLAAATYEVPVSSCKVLLPVKKIRKRHTKVF
jgi:hypothetical protein